MPLQDLVSRASVLLEKELGGRVLDTRSKSVTPNAGSRDVLEQAIALIQSVFVELDNQGDVTRGDAHHLGHVPLIECASRVEAGGEATATIHVANEDAHTVEAALYLSNFVGDSGYEIPSVAGHVTPRIAEIAPGAEASFVIKLKVPRQAPAGTYSGLVQVTNSKYVKAVVVVDVV